MSGGSWDYAYLRLEEVAGRLAQDPDPLRRALGEHVHLVARALHDIEWVDSADKGQGDEVASIMAVFNQDIALAIRQAVQSEVKKLTDLTNRLIFNVPTHKET